MPELDDYVPQYFCERCGEPLRYPAVDGLCPDCEIETDPIDEDSSAVPNIPA